MMATTGRGMGPLRTSDMYKRLGARVEPKGQQDPAAYPCTCRASHLQGIALVCMARVPGSMRWQPRVTPLGSLSLAKA